MNKDQLTRTLERIERELVSRIPQLASDLGSSDPAYCLFLWYTDLSVDVHEPEIAIATESFRAACLDGQHDEQLGDPAEWCVWRPQQTVDAPFPGFPLSSTYCEFVAEECEWIYKQFDFPTNENEDEGKTLAPFRNMMHSTARALNDIEWSEHFPIAEDFVVIATDYIGYWFPEDVVASLGEERVSQLQLQGLIPNWNNDA